MRVDDGHYEIDIGVWEIRGCLSCLNIIIARRKPILEVAPAVYPCLQVESLSVFLHLGLPLPLRRIISITPRSSNSLINSP